MLGIVFSISKLKFILATGLINFGPVMGVLEFEDLK